MWLDGEKIIDPTYKILNFIQSQNKELFDDNEYIILFGNLRTHFLKLFYSVVHIYDIQKDCNFMKQYNQTGFVGTMLIEYPYLKISTIWDIAYQIGEKLTKLKGKKDNKYDALEKEFSAYTNKLNNLNIDWYAEINKIRNEIVHGGVKVASFYFDDNQEKIKNRLCFQMHDNNLNDLIPLSDFYVSKYNTNVVLADNYFALYTNFLYLYLIDFFDFILLKLCKEHNLDSKNFNKYDNSDVLKMFSVNDKYWTVADMEKFKNICMGVLSLYKTNGYCSDNNITQLELESVFPITKTVEF